MNKLREELAATSAISGLKSQEGVYNTTMNYLEDSTLSEDMEQFANTYAELQAAEDYERERAEAGSLADVAIRRISYFLYYLNKYSNNNGSVTVQYKERSFEVGDIVSIEGLYSGVVEAISDGLSYSGNATSTASISNIIPLHDSNASFNCFKEQLKNPMYIIST